MSQAQPAVRPEPSGAAFSYPVRTAEADPSPADRRHLLGLEGVSRAELTEILDSAEHWRERLSRGRLACEELAGVAVVNAFFEDSTRTRVSFELAQHRLGAIPVSFSPAGSSVSKGESLLDTLHTIVAMGVDLVVVRHPSPGTPALLARHLEAGVVNAGDIAHSRVARSAIFGLHTLGASVRLAGPATLVPRGIESLGCEVAESLEQALRGADAVMALRLQRERMEAGLLPSAGEYAREWGLAAG